MSTYLQVELLLEAGQLLLKYNETTAEIHRALESAAAKISNEEVAALVSYSQISVSLGRSLPAFESLSGLHYNVAIQIRVHEILQQVDRDEQTQVIALAQLREIETSTPRHSLTTMTVAIACGASALAALLRGDAGTVAVVGISAGLGLFVRHWLQARRFNIFALPFAAAFIGALLGALAIRCHWTQTPGLALIVPCLMLVPGPHLINGILDFIDNYVTMGIARLALATGILITVGLGLLVGIEMMFSQPPETRGNVGVAQLNVFIDMLLAAIVAAGFATYYNTPSSRLRPAVLGGAIGHGLRSVAISSGWSLAASTFLGSLAVGVCAAWMSRTIKGPFAAVAFAGAVTMMPGMQMYGALRGVVQLVREGPLTNSSAMVTTLGNGVQAAAIVVALALGLLITARMTRIRLTHGPSNRSS